MVLTSFGFALSAKHLGPFNFLILGILIAGMFPFAITAFLGTRNPESNPQSRNIAIHIGRVYIFITTILVPLIADHDFLFISLIGAAVIFASYYYKTYKELQLLIINSLGLLLIGSIAIAGIAGISDSSW